MSDDSINFSSAELADLDPEFKCNFINSLSGYKSVNLVGTIDSNKRTNLAIFNTIINVSTTPPLIGMLIKPPSTPRHTLNNIQETGFYTINHIGPTFYHKAHQTAARYSQDDKSEFDIVGLTPYYSKAIIAPYVTESIVKFGVKMTEKHEIKGNGAVFIVGEVIEVILPKKFVLSDGFIDIGAAATITSSGLDTYYTTRKIARLSYAKPGNDLTIIG